MQILIVLVSFFVLASASSSVELANGLVESISTAIRGRSTEDFIDYFDKNLVFQHCDSFLTRNQFQELYLKTFPSGAIPDFKYSITNASWIIIDKLSVRLNIRAAGKPMILYIEAVTSHGLYGRFKLSKIELLDECEDLPSK